MGAHLSTANPNIFEISFCDQQFGLESSLKNLTFAS